MSDERFPSDWLALREPVDHRSRNPEVIRGAIAWCARYKQGGALDLGAGTGSNARYLRPHLPMISDWLLVDHDDQLLARASPDFRTEVFDLADGIPSHLLDGIQLVTGSALLDLVSPDWLTALVTCCERRGMALLMTLSVDGRIRFDPPQDDDPLVIDAFADDQARAKGIGAALGPNAPDMMQSILSQRGFLAIKGKSDWRLDANDRDLQHMFLEGYAQAAAAANPAAQTTIHNWLRERLSLVGADAHKIEVGHVDIFAVPSA